MQTIPLLELSIVFFPTAFLLAVMFHWKLKAWIALYANVRMLLQEVRHHERLSPARQPSSRLAGMIAVAMARWLLQQKPLQLPSSPEN